MSAIITLLSDFGSQDVYVGVMKGVIAQVALDLCVIDLSHQIPAQNVAAGSFQLANAYRHFPIGTVHIAVIDPGVGSHRRAVAVQIAEGFLVGPDNGLFTGVLKQSPAIAAIELNNPRYWYRPNLSNTFHGRDIFASVGAYLATGVELRELGAAIATSDLVQLPLPGHIQTDTALRGVIQAIDSFGNLITNIPGDSLLGQGWSVELGNVKINSGQTYSDSQPGELLSLVGSHGWVEIAVNGGSAQELLQLDYGAPVNVLYEVNPSRGAY